MTDPNLLFMLRVPVPGSTRPVYICAYEVGHMPPHHTRIAVSVLMAGEVIFPRGQLYCGIPAHQSTDGDYAKEAVLTLVAMKPGDTDSDYFADYTPDQLAFAEEYGDELRMIAAERYGEF